METHTPLSNWYLFWLFVLRQKFHNGLYDVDKYKGVLSNALESMKYPVEKLLNSKDMEGVARQSINSGNEVHGKLKFFNQIFGNAT